MSEFVLVMPDVGEGVAEAELVEWHVKTGDLVREDMVLAAVMTDKATVEIPSPVTGTIVWLAAEIGDRVAVKAPLVRIEVASEVGVEAPEPVAQPGKTDQSAAVGAVAKAAAAAPAIPLASSIRAATAEPDHKPLASPAVRRRAQDNGVDLRQVRGSGPAGRITHDDLDLFLTVGQQKQTPSTGPIRNTGVTEIKITGLRRRIAEKMALSVSKIPHITYVEEVDVSDLEELRTTMNSQRKPDQPKLTILPFLMRALVKAIAEKPLMNANFDDGAGVVTQYGAVHIGVATQTPAGLTVPVVRHVEARGIWDCAAELARVAEAARTGSATRDELIGSTITISSLGSLGGIVSTPLINHPEVAIIGVNKIVTRPVWDGSQFIPRKMMNLSSSFDHRVVDGWDAATFIQRIKSLIETPALIFIES